MSYRGKSNSTELEEVEGRSDDNCGNSDRSRPADKIRGLGGLIFLIDVFLAFLAGNNK